MKQEVFEQAHYANILRNDSYSESAKTEARLALALVPWNDVYFENVLVYTNEIFEREDRAYEIFDTISASEKKVEEYSNKGVDVSSVNNLLNEANDSFYADRYGEAEELLVQVRDELELKRQESSVLGGISFGAKTFVERYWFLILIFLIAVIVGGYFGYQRFNRNLLRRKINRMIHEKKALISLIKKTQIARFKQNKISGLVYNIRVQKYKDRLENIKQELPVLEKRLEIMGSKKDLKRKPAEGF